MVLKNENVDRIFIFRIGSPQGVRREYKTELMRFPQRVQFCCSFLFCRLQKKKWIKIYCFCSLIAQFHSFMASNPLKWHHEHLLFQSTTKSHSLAANVQTVLSLMKAHNPALCNAAARRAQKRHTTSAGSTPRSSESEDAFDELLLGLQDEFGHITL